MNRNFFTVLSFTDGLPCINNLNDDDGNIDFFRSLSFEADSGHRRFLEDAFENESRVPGGNYGPATVHYTDVVSNCSYTS